MLVGECRMQRMASGASRLLNGHAEHDGGVVQLRIWVWARRKLDVRLRAAGLCSGPCEKEFGAENGELVCPV